MGERQLVFFSYFAFYKLRDALLRGKASAFLSGKMGDENLYADEDEDDSPEEFRAQALANGLAEGDAEEIAEQAEEHGHDADGKQRICQLRHAAIARARERYADCECIYACGYGKHYLSLHLAWVEVALLPVAKRLPYHLHAEECQEGECHPVVEGLYVSAETGCAHPAHEGHGSLEESEEKRHAEDGLPLVA